MVLTCVRTHSYRIIGFWLSASGLRIVENILLTAEAANAGRDTTMSSLVRTELYASFQEGIVNVKTIDPARVAGPETVTPGGGRSDSQRRSQSPHTGRVRVLGRDDD